MARALARVDLAAVEHNVKRLRGALAPGTLTCAVVKADGYGHGAVECARAAQQAGAEWIAVAGADEARQLRDAGIEGRLLVLGSLDAEDLATALAADADIVAW